VGFQPALTSDAVIAVRAAPELLYGEGVNDRKDHRNLDARFDLAFERPPL
jgi:hypothetical protein